MRAMWAVAGLGVLLAVTAMRGPFGMRGAVLLTVPFVALPLSSGLAAKYRLSRIAEIQPGRPGQAVHRITPPSATQVTANQDNDVSLAMRPRTLHLTMRGYLYTAGVALAPAFVLWVLSLVLRGITGPSNLAILGKYVVALFVWGWALWSCISFFRNRIRERQLFINGELSESFVLTKSRTRYGASSRTVAVTRAVRVFKIG
jgi:hypothetical protein